MKNIFYGLAGEGMGHASRTHAMIENLPDFQVHLFTFGEAWDYFNRIGYPFLHKIEGVHFGRDKNNVISMWGTLINFARFYSHSRRNVKYIIEQANKYDPCLFVSDCEILTPKAARKLGKPLLSIDNQHKFSRTIDKSLPFDLRVYAWLMGIWFEVSCPKPDLAIISTFYHSAVKKRYCKKTILTNCFMRKSIEDIKPTQGDYVLVYYKPSIGPKMLKALSHTNEKVVVFACPPEQQIEGFEYHDLDSEKFMQALAGCKAIFCAAGNQTLGEAAFYGKPCFTVPEPNQAEQRINAYYIDKMNYGATVSVDRLMSCDVFNFLDNLEKYNNKSNINGVHIAADQVRKFSE